MPASSENVVGCSICGTYHIRPGSMRQANPLTEVGFCEQCGKETRTSRGTWTCTSCHQATIRVDTIKAGASRDGGWHHVGYCDHCKTNRKLVLHVKAMSGTELFNKIGEMRASGIPIGIATRSGDGPWGVLGGDVADRPGNPGVPVKRHGRSPAGSTMPVRVKGNGKSAVDLLDDYVKKSG